jgi:ketosteroid isomerase-like protein
VKLSLKLEILILMTMRLFFLLLMLNLMPTAFCAEGELPASVDSLYREIIRTVANADFDAMAATYHGDAVLVTMDNSRPISSVMPLWKAAGEKHKKAGGSAFLNFRFSSRLSSGGTTFDTGIFRYGTRDRQGVEKLSYTHFQDLTVKKNNQWTTLMERQMGNASLAEWDALPAWK